MSVSEKSPAPASIPTETGGHLWNFPARPITSASRAGLIALWTAVALVLGYTLRPDLDFLDRAPAIGNDEARWLAAWLRTWPDEWDL